jgi:uncharacterized protein
MELYFLIAGRRWLGNSQNCETKRAPGTGLPMKSKKADISRKAVKNQKSPGPSRPKPAVKAPITAAAKARRMPKSNRLKIPPILLEGDSPAAPPASGPGQRYALGPTPPAERFPAAEVELPETYGTQHLYLMSRDPRWLYAHWDFGREEIKSCNAKSADGHMVLRVYRDAIAGEPISQIHLHPQSRDWFVPVPHPATKYLAELGYYDTAGKWVGRARSAATLTPPDTLADDTSVRFATIPWDVPFEQLVALVKTALRDHVPLTEALLQLRAEGHKHLPAAAQITSQWTAQQDKALAQVISLDQVRRVWIGSMEITELIRRQLEQHVSSQSAAQLGLPTSPSAALGSVSSPFGGMERQRGFWFNVNAELIIYGSTEPDAKVTIAGRAIKLRGDGSFSFRFALPDGNYALPASAQSADGEETRRAELNFSRQSHYQGDVGTHPQDKALQPPVAAAVS